MRTSKEWGRELGEAIEDASRQGQHMGFGKLKELLGDVVKAARDEMLHELLTNDESHWRSTIRGYLEVD